MTKFEEEIERRLVAINRLIASGAKTKERRNLQRERADLEAKLAKVRAT